MINKAEAIDWIIKYFMIISLFFWVSFFFSFLIREQKDSVFTSSKAQIETQEFITKHKIVEVISSASMMILVLKDYS